MVQQPRNKAQHYSSAVDTAIAKRVAVLMPVYNGETHIKEAIESILTQTYTGFDLFVINDGSTDSTEQVVQSITDPRIRYIRNEKNMGLPATLNRGLSLIDHEYIARMDADDIALPYRLEKQVAFMDRNPSHVLCAGQLAYFGSMSSISHFPATDAQIKAYMIFNNCIAHPTVMLRNKVLKQRALLYDPSTMFPLDDYEFWLRVEDAGKFHILDDVLLKYRVGGQNYSMKVLHEKRRAQYYKLYERILNRLDIPATEETLDLHFNLSFAHSKYPLPSPAKVRTHMNRLVEANSKAGYCDGATLKSQLEAKWKKLFYIYADKSVIKGTGFIFAGGGASASSIKYLLRSWVSRTIRNKQ